MKNNPRNMATELVSMQLANWYWSCDTLDRAAKLLEIEKSGNVYEHLKGLHHTPYGAMAEEDLEKLPSDIAKFLQLPDGFDFGHVNSHRPKSAPPNRYQKLWRFISLMACRQ